jgi:hypothetical protein
MADVGDVVFDQQHRQGGAHAAVHGVGDGRAADAVAGLVHRVAQALADGVVALGGGALQAGLVGIVGAQQHVAHGVDRDLARDLARGVAAHAVGHHKEAGLLVDEEVVFVVLADGPQIGARGGFKTHGGSRVHPARGQGEGKRKRAQRGPAPD